MIDWAELVERRLVEENDPDSHVEPDPHTFHPSAISRCERTAMKSKFGLDENSVNDLWNFHIGTERHEWMEAQFEDYPGLEFEVPVEVEVEPGITFTGRTDVYDRHEDEIYDFKTRKGWSYFDGPGDAHKDQVTVYMRATGASQARIVYIVKSAPWDSDEPIVRQSEPIEYDEERFQNILDKALRIREAVEENGIPKTVAGIPFDRCGCFICENEEVVE